jgi:hypothetical protein
MQPCLSHRNKTTVTLWNFEKIFFRKSMVNTCHANTHEIILRQGYYKNL